MKKIRNSFSIIVAFLLSLSSCGDSDQHTEYFDNGTLRVVGRFEDGVKNGDWTYFKSNKDTLKTIKFSMGDTLELREFTNGVLFAYTLFENGIRFTEKTYFPNGLVASAYNLAGDIPKEYEEYYENGQLRLKADNYGNGIHLFYDTLGYEYEIYFQDFERLDSLTRKTGVKIEPPISQN